VGVSSPNPHPVRGLDIPYLADYAFHTLSTDPEDKGLINFPILTYRPNSVFLLETRAQPMKRAKRMPKAWKN